MRILAIDTSTAAASAALIEDGTLCCEYILNDGKKHSEKLITLIDMVIKSCGLEVSDIDVFACSTGPGSFTGLRVGASAIKGMAQALDKVVIGVPTLDSLAFNLWGYKGYVCPILDAQRNMVYASLYAFEADDMAKIKDFYAIEVSELMKELSSFDKNIVFLGDGISIFRKEIKESLGKARFAPAGFIYPRASSVASLAVFKYGKGEISKYSDLKIHYIRKSQAEVEYEKRHSVSIEVMKIEDIDAVVEIEKSSFETPWSRESFISEIEKNDLAQYLVAKIGGKVVGYAGMWFILDETHITNIAVHPDYQDRGIGNKLIKAIIESTKENDLRSITLEVRNTNKKAIYLYEKNGFEASGIRKGYYSDTNDDAIIMWKEI